MIMNYIDTVVPTIMFAPIGDEAAQGINEVIAQIRSILVGLIVINLADIIAERASVLEG